ncbi:acyl carrier protein [Pseudoflavonifractor phocaeensis]|uniref:acyl carrier protein n=1 Tax=Pseudoflavonifractor phocaeensis TaxID=1870988 RepID=UPI002285512B
MEINFENVRDIIVNTLSCDADQVTMETNLFEDLEADSLEAVELSLALEDAFGVGIADEDMTKIKTVSDIVAYLESKKQ